nr:conserved hypothetical protein [Bartonella sp. AR 15-3]
MQEKVYFIQAFEQQDWINGIKTENVLINLLTSFQANRRNSNSDSNGSYHCNEKRKPIAIL